MTLKGRSKSRPRAAATTVTIYVPVCRVVVFGGLSHFLWYKTIVHPISQLYTSQHTHNKHTNENTNKESSDYARCLPHPLANEVITTERRRRRMREFRRRALRSN